MNSSFLSKDNRNTFIEENKKFVYNVTQNICKRKLQWENDDELSIALIAFNHACDTYEIVKGNFYSYASVLIRNALFDHFRKIKKSPYLMFEGQEEKMDVIDIKISLNEFEKSIEKRNRAEEILLFSKELIEYKLSFDALIDAAPSHKDTRNAVLNLAFQCVKEDSILLYVKEKKMLPIKEILFISTVNRKFIEKWRRYLLVLILLLSTEQYPYIKSYLNIKAGDRVD